MKILQRMKRFFSCDSLYDYKNDLICSYGEDGKSVLQMWYAPASPMLEFYGLDWTTEFWTIIDTENPIRSLGTYISLTAAMKDWNKFTTMRLKARRNLRRLKS